MSDAVLSDDQVFTPAMLSDEQVFSHPTPGVRAAIGAPTSVESADGEDLQGRFAVLHAGDVVASHDVNMRPNDVHRDKTGTDSGERADLEQRVQRIVAGIDPRMLADSLTTDEGAPVVGADGLVEAGNARAIALQRIQRVPGEKAAAYKAWLTQAAPVLGIDPAEVEAIDKPMLVRIRSTPADRAGVGRPLASMRFEPAMRSAAAELASAKKDGREIQLDGESELSPDTAEILQFLAANADQEDTINAVLKAAKGIMHGKSPEDAERSEHRKDAAPGDGAGSESETAPSDQSSHQGDAPSGSAEGVAPEWMDFSPETGTLAVPREEMPQIRAEHRGALTQFLLARDIPHAQEEVQPEDLKPTQAAWSRQKVAKAVDFKEGDRAVLVSAEGHVLDGHHQWLGKLAKGEPLRVIRFNAPIQKLLEHAKEFPSAEVAG